MSESENQEPVCSSDSSGDPEVVGSKTGDDGEASNEAEAKPVPHDSPEHVTKNSDPEVVSSSKDSPVQIRNNQEMRDSKLDEDDEDDDSNDGVGGGGGGGSNGDGGLPPICSPFAPHGSSNSKSNPFGSGTNILRGPILRPSAFKFSCSSPQQQQQGPSQQPSSSFMLRPPKLIPTSGSVGCKVQAQAASSTSTLQFVPLEKEEEEGDQSGSLSQVGSTSSQDAGPSSSSGGESFVFGRNFSERAVVEVVEGSGDGAGGKKRKIEGEEDVSVVGGSKKLSVVISEEGKEGEVVSREVITGEEDEVNVLQLHCRLFIFDGSNSTWIERGRGLLRLNDSKTADDKNVVNSRLIVRTKGSLRVMLNTKVWDGMRVERVGDKNVRLMAVDLEAVEKEVKEEEDKEASGGSAVRIFLVMTTSISDAVSLMNALESRLRRLTSLN